ncbi:MAG: Mur ligase family protein [Verrucomicrobiales bacterium]
MPRLPKRIHIIGISGRIVSGLALELKRRGCRITGSDSQVFPPSDVWLIKNGINFFSTYAARHVPKDADLVIVGPLITSGNVEWRSALRKKIPVIRWPHFINRYLMQKPGENLVVVGTNGKSTTSAMLAWICDQADPAHPVDRLIGGIGRNEVESVRWRGAKTRVIEGDEFLTGLDDPTPKFLHYQPTLGVVTNIRHDHCEFYPSAQEYNELFERFVRLIPLHGTLVLHADEPLAPKLTAECPGHTVQVGTIRKVDYRITALKEKRHSTEFMLNGVRFALPLFGKFNAKNAALAAAAAAQQGVSLQVSAAALGTFRGLHMRQEIHCDGAQFTLIEDEAFHPHALNELLGSLRRRYPKRRLVVVFQPRLTGGREDIFQRELPSALGVGDLILALPAWGWNTPDRPPFDNALLARQTRRRGVSWRACQNGEELCKSFARELREKDVVLLSLGFRREAIRDQLVRLATH